MTMLILLKLGIHISLTTEPSRTVTLMMLEQLVLFITIVLCCKSNAYLT